MPMPRYRKKFSAANEAALPRYFLLTCPHIIPEAGLLSRCERLPVISWHVLELCFHPRPLCPYAPGRDDERELFPALLRSIR